MPRWCSDKAVASWPQGRGFESRLELNFLLKFFIKEIVPTRSKRSNVFRHVPTLEREIRVSEWPISDRFETCRNMLERISDAISGTLVISKISERIRGSP